MYKMFGKNNNAFTIMEIMIVVLILGVLTMIALPRFTGTFERVRAAEGVQILGALLRAQKAFEAENGNFTNNLANLDVEINNAEYFNLPPTVAAANPIASITRTGAYTLRIDDQGNITCAGGGAFTCGQAGY